ncbi:MAG: oligosaccharide flippase family protein [Lutibacter sp.]|nr:oligosaccharide flippase family protein [Lutibacter sp.]
MTIGTSVAQLISLVFSPFIARLYGPESIGIQGVFLSLVGIMVTFSAMSYPNSIVLPKRDVDAMGLVFLSIYISLVTSIIIYVAIFFFGENILNLLNSQEISHYLFLLPIAIFITVLYTIFGEWLSREKSFRIASMSIIILAVVVTGLKVFFGRISPSGLSLIIAYIVGYLITTFITFLIWKKIRRIKFNRSIKVNIIPLALDYKDFAVFRTSQNFINAISQSLPVFLLSGFFSVSAAGQYSISISLLGVPLAIIGGSVMSVFYPRVTEAIRNGEDVRSLIIITTKGLMRISIIPFLIIAVYGPELFHFIFGVQWIIAGQYSQWLSLFYFFQLINKAPMAAVAALRLQGGLLVYEIVGTATKVLALWLGFVFFKDALVAIALFSIFGALAYMWLTLWVIKTSGKKNSSITST